MAAYRRIAILCCLTLLALVTPVRGEWPSWKLPSLNPFSKSTSKTTHPSWPSTGGYPPWTKAPPPAAHPSTWSKMNQGTKNFFTKTKDALTPWDDHPAPPPRSATGVRTASKPKEQKPGFFASWFKSEPERPEPMSVPEWMAQPRPEF